MQPVHVLAVIAAKPSMRDKILQAFHANAPVVHAEVGCIEYQATVDCEAQAGKVFRVKTLRPC
jgi:quinol monooxygenase YgiN